MKASIKKGITVTIILSSMIGQLYAEEEKTIISNTQVGTGAAGGAATVGLGLSIGKFYSNRRVKELETPVEIFNNEFTKQLDHSGLVGGDRVFITYEGHVNQDLINELKKQKNHIAQEIQKLEDAFSIAENNARVAINSRDRIVNNNTANYLVNEIDKLKIQLNYLDGEVNKLLSVRDSKVLIIKEITLNEKAGESVSKHIEDMESKGYTTKQVKVLSAAQAKKLFKHLKRAKAGAVAIVLAGTIILGEELTAGYIAGKLEEALDFDIEY